MPAVLRIIVGASGSPGSLRALRYAQHLARDYDATLVPVLAWLPPCGDLADRRTPNQELRHLWAQDAHQKLEDTLNLAWGTPPTGLPVQPLIRRGEPGPVLAAAALATCCWSELQPRHQVGEPRKEQRTVRTPRFRTIIGLISGPAIIAAGLGGPS